MLGIAALSVVVYVFSVETYILAMILVVPLAYVLSVVGAVVLIVLELIQASRRARPANNG